MSPSVSLCFVASNVGLLVNINELTKGRGEVSVEEMKIERRKRRVDDLLQNVAHQSDEVEQCSRNISFRFFLTPLELIPSDIDKNRIGSVKFGQTRLDGGIGSQYAVLEDSVTEVMPCDLLISSLGYESISIEGVPFDHRKKVIPNIRGRVVKDNEINAGMYCSGWVKRGPRGIVGTNIADAQETVQSVLEDIQRRDIFHGNKRKEGSEFLRREGMLSKAVDWDGYLKINAYEKTNGAMLRGRERQKITSIDKMLAIATA